MRDQLIEYLYYCLYYYQAVRETPRILKESALIIKNNLEAQVIEENINEDDLLLNEICIQLRETTPMQDYGKIKNHLRNIILNINTQNYMKVILFYCDKLFLDYL